MKRFSSRCVGSKPTVNKPFTVQRFCRLSCEYQASCLGKIGNVWRCNYRLCILHIGYYLAIPCQLKMPLRGSAPTLRALLVTCTINAYPITFFFFFFFWCRHNYVKRLSRPAKKIFDSHIRTPLPHRPVVKAPDKRNISYCAESKQFLTRNIFVASG